ncbi:MAG: DNA internalization-related competence protein ComEC/Rec2 [Thalassotalea sp.]
MDWWLITFFIGAILSLFLPIVPAFSYVIFLTALSLLLFYLKRARKAIGLLFGILWILFTAAIYNQALNLNDIEFSHFYQKQITVQGTITSLVTEQDLKANVRFNFIIDHFDNKKLSHPVHVRLSWLAPSHSLAQNQRWQLLVKLKPAHGLANAGGFSYQTWLRKNNLIASGYVVNKKNTAIKNILLVVDSSLRQQWFDQFSSKLENNAHAAVLLALTFGTRDKLQKTDWQILQVTGTQHLLAISGLHIGLIAGASYWLTLFLFRVLPSQFLPPSIQIKCLNTNLDIVAICVSLFFAYFYSYLAGFSAPTSRAVIMLSLFYAAKVFAIELNKTRLLLITVTIVVICQPMTILGVGFWLSFYAVTIIFYLHWLYQHYLTSGNAWRNFLVSLVLIQLGLSLFILPLAGFLQYQIPLAALVANLVAVPLLSFICLPLVLLSFVCFLLFGGFAWLTALSHYFLALLWQWLQLFSHLSFLQISVQWSYLCALILLLALAVLILNKVNYRKLYSLLLLSALTVSFTVFYFARADRSKDTEPWALHVFDVGQGLAVLIEKKQRAILYDTGASYPSGFVMAEAVIVPYLKQRGIARLDRPNIDKVIISHSDNDHAGGLSWLQANVEIGDIIANDKSLQPTINCTHENSFIWQGIRFDILAPITINSGQKNDDSCVIKITDGLYSVLLTGDISQKIEKQLVDESRQELSSDVLLAPHHGSNTSSSEEFITAVSPRYVVFSAGFMNRWSMPTEKVLAKYEKYQVIPLKTAESGMISFIFSHQSFNLTEYKKQRYPFWFAN